MCMYVYLSASFGLCQLGGVWHFHWFFCTFCPMHQNTVPLGGGICVYFLKSVRKGRFRNIGLGGGGEVFICFGTEPEIERCA